MVVSSSRKEAAAEPEGAAMGLYNSDRPAMLRSFSRLILLGVALTAGACSGGLAACGIGLERQAPSDAGGQPSANAKPVDPTAPPARPRVVALGDSLTAGYGLLESQAYPALLQTKIDEEGYAFEVVNAGVSGDTSAGGLRRLDWALEGNVRVLILALGANDGLRGLPIAEMKENLGTIIDRARERNIVVLLAGMEAPPNYGPEYVQAFRAAYREVSASKRVLLVPFLLDRVAGVGTLNQGDGIHPNVEGARIIADTIWPVLRNLLDQMAGSQ
jgi:acyl-CoA thioesterase-1